MYLYSHSHHPEDGLVSVKNVGEYYVIKITFINPSAFVGPFKKIYTFD
jgi:hypothetical protein